MTLKMLQSLLESLTNGELKNFRNIVLIAGLCYLVKLSFKFLWNLYSGLVTFIIPSIWPRNFPKEYGPWAGNRSHNSHFLACLEMCSCAG